MPGRAARKARRVWRLQEALDGTWVAPRPRLPARTTAARLLRSVAHYDLPVVMSNPVAADAVHRACLRLGSPSYVHALERGWSIDALSEAIEDLESPC